MWSSATTKAVLHWRVFAFFLEEVGVSLGEVGVFLGGGFAVLQLWSYKCSLQSPDTAEQVTFKDYRADVWAVDGETC